MGGVATDREDGPLAGDALTRSSNQHGLLGTVEEAVALPLAPGWLEVMLEAKDSDGNVGRDSIRLWVGSRLYLPIIVK